MVYILLTAFFITAVSLILYMAKKGRTYASLKDGGGISPEEDADMSAARLRKAKKALPNPAFIQSMLEQTVEELEKTAPGEFEAGLKWLADNKNRLFSEAEQICAQQANLSMKLPVNKKGNLRIYEAAGCFILRSGGNFEQEELVKYMEALNDKADMKLEEGFLLPFCLRLCLLEHITQAAVQMLGSARNYNKISRLVKENKNESLSKELNQDSTGESFYNLMLVISRAQPSPELTALCERALNMRGLDKATLLEEIRLAHSKLSAAVAASVKRLITIGDIEAENVVEESFASERILLNDPAGAYPRSNKTTRSACRVALGRMSRRYRVPEKDILLAAREIAEAGEDPGGICACLIGARREELLDDLFLQGKIKSKKAYAGKKQMGVYYFCALGIITAFMLAPLVWFAVNAANSLKWLYGLITALAGIVPAYVMTEILLNSMINIFIKPAVVPGLKEELCDIPEYKTAVVIPALLSSKKRAAEVCSQLERHYLSNRCENAVYVLLGDYRDGPNQHEANDEEIYAEAERGVRALNAKYPQTGFIYLHRDRSYVLRDKKYMGYERKRGALMQLAEVCSGKENAYFKGDASGLKGTKYILTVDADTRLAPGALLKLIARAAHPLNSPVYDKEKGRIIRGYGVIQPGMGTAISSLKTYFSRFFSPKGGLDAYAGLVSDVYQDIFDSASFGGKGIIDVNAYQMAIGERIPENRVLSHDLLEGSYLRCATAGDVKFFDSFPCEPLAYYKRAHRWTRGDWQLLKWVFKDELSPLARFKIFANMFRTLFPGSVLLLLLLSVSVLPGNMLAYFAFALQAVFYPLGLEVFSKAVGVYRAIKRKYTLRDALPDIWAVIVRLALNFVFLPYEAYIYADAKIRALYRMFISKKKMLEWVTAADSEKGRTTGNAYAAEMWPCSVFGAVYFLIAAAYGRNLILPVLLGLAWAFAPYIAYRLSFSADLKKERLLPEQLYSLRMLAARTYRFFYEGMNEDTHYLPPDNFQQRPYRGFADRTSATNIGFGALAPLCAASMRIISLPMALDILDKSLSTIENLEKWHGNLYNWYRISDISPMEPRYVSSVDSGNFLCCLLACRGMLNGLFRHSVMDVKVRQSLRMTLMSVVDERSISKELYGIINQYDGALAAAENIVLVRSVLEQICSDERLEPVRGIGFVRDVYKGFMQMYDRLGIEGACSESLYEMSISPDDFFENDSAKSKGMAYISELSQKAEALRRRIDQLMEQCELSRLYDSKKKLFSIGYNVREDKLSSHYYDLLASESRLCSYYAAASSVVPAEHWFALGRPITRIENEPVLLSWSGTMFEYLMPELFLDTHRDTLLGRSVDGAVRAQIAYGRWENIPWGISESAYYALDRQKEYKYKAFGVYETALSACPRERVVSPYSTLLALERFPKESMENLVKLVQRGGAGSLGMFEALDFSHSRITDNYGAGELVATYMAHHNGMSLCALCNLLENSAVRSGFMGNDMIKAAALLLEEKPPEGAAPRRVREEVKIKSFAMTSFKAAPGRVQTLTNGSLRGCYFADGTAALWFKELALTLPLANGGVLRGGTSLYIKDGLTQSVIWPGNIEGVVREDKCIFSYNGNNLKINEEIILCADKNIEIRKIELENKSVQTRELTVTLAHDAVLCPEEDFYAHRVFNKLFVSALKSDGGAILKRRGKRGETDGCLALKSVGNFRSEWFCTDRFAFYGRCNTETPDMIACAEERPGDFKEVPIEPMLAQSVKIYLRPGERSFVKFYTAASVNEAEAEELLKRLDDSDFKKEAELAGAQAAARMNYYLVTPHEAKMAGQIIFDALKGGKAGDTKASGRRELLWSMGISGDHPIMIIHCPPEFSAESLVSAVRIYRYICFLGFRMDLLVLDFSEQDYIQADYTRVENVLAAVERGDNEVVHHRCRHEKEDIVQTFKTMACCYIDLAGGEKHKENNNIRVEKKMELAPAEYPPSRIEPGNIRLYNGYGGFNEDGSEYVIITRRGRSTPLPWNNVIAQENFGTVVSENGGGFTWRNNSGLEKITDFKNDPVLNIPNEYIYIRDEDNGRFWSISASPVNRGDEYKTVHGQGYTYFEYNGFGLEQRQTVFVHRELPIKLYDIRLSGGRSELRNISVTLCIEGALGKDLKESLKFISCGREGGLAYIERDGKYVYMYMPGEYQVCLDRDAFFGDGCISEPLGMRMKNMPESGGGSPFLSGRAYLEPASEMKLWCALGCADSLEEARRHIDLVIERGVRGCLEDVKEFWDKRLEVIRASTPDKAFDFMFNRWLLYQSYSSRFYGRTGFYQVGGAYGFRDQLQDCLALVYSDPALVKEHILRCAGHQFKEGDVQHWWHPERRGVRTKISDDLLFLPYTACRYAEITGDREIFDLKAPYLTGRMPDKEKDIYEEPAVEGEASLYDHCVRALRRAMRTGGHGLPLMGTGDWNDGMDEIGSQGRGESVWLGWFLLDVIGEFLPVARARGDMAFAEELVFFAHGLKQALEKAWDGRWYLRAITDGGKKIGSAESYECRIDAISQAWSVISGMGEPDRQKTAMESVMELLVDRSAGIVRLLWPPFDKHEPYAGYIQRYPGGLRENGGQYTHAAVWVLKALAMLGEADKAGEVMSMLNPVNHALTTQQACVYKGEPYVAAGDVYSCGENAGRCGWSWYTGAAAWMYAVFLEDILGIRVCGDKITFQPCLPPEWDRASVEYAYGQSVYKIEIFNPERRSTGVRSLLLDGNAVDEIALEDDKKQHTVKVII